MRFFWNSLISEPFNWNKLSIYNKNILCFAKTQQPKRKVSSVLTLFYFVCKMRIQAQAKLR